MGSLCFNPRTPCGVRLNPGCRMTNCYLVSIHALLAECDTYGVMLISSKDVSIHALLAECDPVPVILLISGLVSIHALLAECDPSEIIISGKWQSFNPRTPCGVRQFVSDWKHTITWFQSTHSLRSATIRVKYEDCPHIVSIHALLAECDRRRRSSPPSSTRFNPRTPCGVRHAALTY